MDDWGWAEVLTADEIREDCPDPDQVVSARYWHRIRNGFRDSRYHGIVARYRDRDPAFGVRLEGPWSWLDAANEEAALERFLASSDA
jgi:hypothetical protein